ncbi:unnamed protein product [Candidula unifasciata]|uniref:G-protein coupled receptors family 2 profile 2 domain-containing protein n=1 Tax=Candidula unifasciata TaxID=100452 RepID=A0A8S3ZDC3_9EUPU|nr:unnamed protein product [Candidula unifasciata]
MKKLIRSCILLVVVSVFFLGAGEASNSSTVSNGQVERIHSTSQINTMNSVDKANGLILAEHVRRVTRSTNGVATLNCSWQGDFNITLAIEQGTGFQADLCSWECYGESNRGNTEKRSSCLGSELSCPLCYCDSVCSLYRDCCGVTPGNVSNNKTDSSTPQQSYSCFHTDDLTAVYIIASCPARATTSVGSIESSNLIQQSSRTHSTAKLQASISEVQCNTCLFSPELIRLITSANTGNTYCNHHCLHCTERRYANDTDIVWRERKSCTTQMVSNEAGPANENNTGSQDVYCPTVYERPNNVSTRQCDSLFHSKIETTSVNTCQSELLESLCNLSSAVVEQLEQLCELYISPVYTGDVIYQNIFCYLCQETCLPVVCSPGRAVANTTTSSESYCKMEDSQHSKDLYKLYVTVYIPLLSESSSGRGKQDFDSDIITSKQGQSDESMCSDSQSRLCIDERDDTLDVATQSEVDDLVSSLTKQFKAFCGEMGNIYGVNDLLHPEGRTDKNQNKEVVLEKSERGFSHFPTVRRRTMSEVELTTLDIDSDGIQQPANHRVTPEEQTDKKVNPMTFKGNLINSLQRYFVSGMTSLGVAKYAFQLHSVHANNKRFQNKQSVEHWEDVSESLRCDSQSAMTAIVLARLPSAADRDVFESNLLHHFNGAKNITMDTTVVNVEMVLSSSDKVSLIAGQPVYYFSSLNKECQVFTQPDQLTQRFGDVACLGDECRIVPFNLVSSCPYITLNISDFSISKDCELTKDGVTLRKSQYIQGNETIDICIVTFRSIFKYQTDIHSKVSLISIIESLLTMTSLSLSLACLLLTFITYVTFPTLRSLPGKNNLIMVTLLFIAQLLVMLHTMPTKHSTACAAMGVLLHYSWLFTVLWMCICSFHMFHVFVIRRGVPSSRRSDTFYLTRYIVTCGSLALFVVLFVVFSNVYISNYGNIGYGGHVCYLNSSILVGVAFLLPLTVVLLLNSFFFSMTVYTISRIGDVKKHSGHDRRNIHIYFRLSSLTGLCWILALLAEIPGLRPLRCLSILVNGSQGVAILLSYVCNRRVARMWLHLLKSRSTWLDKKPADSSRQLTLSTSL